MNNVKLVLSFFTRLPVGTIDFTEEKWRNAIRYTPFVGVILGLLLVSIALLLQRIDSIILSLILFVTYTYLTGALHLDGLSDTADGIFSHRPRERMLEIMRDSHIGAFGVIMLIVVVAGNILLLSYTSLLTLFFYPIVGRTVGMLVCKGSSYARPNGFGRIFVEEAGKKVSFYIVVLFMTVMVFTTLWLQQWHICIALLTTYFISVWIVKRIHRTLHGITGDVVGFIVEVSQLLFLLFTYIGGVYL